METSISPATCEFRLIDAVNVHIVGEKPGDASGQAVHLELAACKEIAVLLAQTVGRIASKKGRKLGIRLPVLFGEITIAGSRSRQAREA